MQQCLFAQLYSSHRFPGFRLVPNHLFISLMTSKLIYKRVISLTAKNGSLKAGFLSVLTVEDVSSGPLGVMALRQLCTSWGRYVIIPESWCSVCVGHTPCTGVDCVTVPLSQNKTQYVTNTYILYMTYSISLTEIAEIVLPITTLLARNICFAPCIL